MIEYDGAKATANGNGVATTFSFSPLKIFEAADLRVWLRDPSGVETELSQGASDVTFAVEVVSYPGTGQIRYPAVGGSPLATGYSLVMKPDPELHQEVDLENQGGYNPEVLENALDRAVVQQKAIQETLDRSLQVPVTDNRTPTQYLADLVDEITVVAQAAADDATTQAGIATTQAGIATTQAGNASASAIAAAASAVTAANAADNLKATSTTSFLIGTGSKLFATQAGKAFQVGGFVMVASNANGANYMWGQITGYSGTSLTVNVLSVGGSGTLADWNIAVSGIKGDQGSPGAPGPGTGDVVGPASVVANRIATFNGTTGKLLQDGGLAITTAMTVLAGLTPAADRIPIFTGAGSAALQTVTTDTKALLAAANYAAVLALLGLTLPGNRRILFDNAGVIGGSANFTMTTDGDLNTLLKLTDNGAVDFESVNSTANVPIPTANQVRVFNRRHSRSLFTMKNEDGFETFAQPMFGSSWVKSYIAPIITSAGAASVTSIGGVVLIGTLSIPAIGSTNFRDRNSRFMLLGDAGGGDRAGIKINQARYYRSATAGIGGFRAEILFATDTNVTGHQMFVGVQPGIDTNFSTGDPSSYTDCFGIGYDAADANSGNFFVMHNDASGTCTRVDTGVARATNTAWRLILDCPTGNATIMYWHLTNMVTGTVASGSINSNLPTADTKMRFVAQMNKAATGTEPQFICYTATVEAPIN